MTKTRIDLPSYPREDVYGFEHFTRREREVMHVYCTVHGATYRTVAERLGIKTQTVKNHMLEIRRKAAAHHIGNVCYLYGRVVESIPTPALRPEQV